ncbi:MULTISPECIES: nickel-dependent hydrogenase large subunit [Ferrimonas]|uniref:hydrogenase large subunit n=1 Tax=Ferrimonas TaxID=44011 RepID=UPI00040ADC6D|nr:MULTISPECIES: nickel-dependent hydrogenase large subunit [Ferrimonas]USD36389.1 nickel-dependent hydrogenase large subunit [Ferrimonas sp. SCSIO 43195]
MSSYKVPVGPLHVALEEPMYFKVEVEGETIKGIDITAGHVHRGLEYLAVKRNFYQNITLTERLCSLCSNSHPTTYCMALETIGGIEVPQRAQYLRVIADEVKRVASNLFNVGIMAHIIGFDSLFMHVLETREVMQDVKETVYGNRMDLGANCIGGVKYNLDADKVAYLTEKVQGMIPAVEEIKALYNSDHFIVSRTQGVGVLTLEDVKDYGLVGPVARASGLAYDVRVQASYAIYDQLDMEIQTRSGGDVWSRAMVRIDEVLVALDLILQCLAKLPQGPIAITTLPSIPAGEAIAKSEAPRGELIYYLRTDGSDKPERLKWRVPSYPNWDALQTMMAGEKIADVPLMVNSIDPCISCTER